LDANCAEAGNSIVMELICGACHGRLLVEAPGTTVACPHCGTHLQTPAHPATDAPFFPGPDDGSANGPDPAEDTVRLNPWEVPGASSRAAPPESFLGNPVPATAAGPQPGSVSSSSSLDLAGGQAEAVPVIRVSETGSIVVSTAPAEGSKPLQQNRAGEPAIDVNGAQTAAASPATPAEPAQHAAEAVVPAAASSTETVGKPAPLGAACAAEPREADSPRTAAAPPVSPPRAAAEGVVVLSSVILIILLSYASAMTLLCLYLVMTRPSTLDLPDLAPPSRSKKVTTLIYLPPGKELPPANLMRLGESRQFGAVRVTPVRVTRGPVTFAFYKPEEDEQRAPEGPVLKLHLRFDNVSRDQQFVPLDRQLVFTKEPDRQEYGLFKTNNFVCKVDDRARLAKHVCVFEMSPNSEWLLCAQNLDRELKPGEYVETFIATTPDDIDSLSGDLVWRVHFRKGYNPNSFRGVTTLIEVLFRSSEIVDEAPPAEAAAKDA
jgi:hypothetical protein